MGVAVFQEEKNVQTKGTACSKELEDAVELRKEWEPEMKLVLRADKRAQGSRELYPEGMGALESFINIIILKNSND